MEPGEFLAVRSACVAEAKAAGDKEAAAAIGRLRKPSVAAWAINDAVRADEALVADLDDVRQLARLKLAGLVIGRALYERTLRLEEALAVAREGRMT